MRVIVKPKVWSSMVLSDEGRLILFLCFFLQMAAKSSTLSHVSFLMSMMRTKSTRALSFSFYQHFAVQNDQLRLKSSKTVLKAFQLIFPWLKMKRKTLCISNLDSWVDQKKHLNKDAQKKCLWSGDVRWPASIFPFSRITFSSSKKLNFLIQSNIRQVPNILVFLISCTRPTSFAWLTGRTLSLLQLECSREEECLVRAKNFSARNPQLFSFSSLLTEVPKNRSHPRLIQEYFSCLFFFFRWRASILLNCSSMDDFVFFSSSKSPCGTVCMKRCRRVGSSGEKVWLW